MVDEQRKSIETKLAENHSYLSKVLKLMAKNGESASQSDGGGVTNTSGFNIRNEGKVPVEVTIVNGQGKHVF